MVLLAYSLLCLCFLLDVVLPEVFYLDFRMPLLVLFLSYLGLRMRFEGLLGFLILFSLLARVYSGVGFFDIFVSSTLVFFVVSRFRTEIYLGSLLAQSFWTFVMTFCLYLTWGYFDQPSGFLPRLPLLASAARQGCLASLLSIPLFSLWDRLLFFARGQSFKRRGYYRSAFFDDPGRF